MSNSFTIRVYGLLLKDETQVLLTKERIGNFCFTKFPGGGLEFGEGTIECLQREWLEEFNVRIEVYEHFYTTDFCQLSAFDTSKQVLSIYYLVTCSDISSLDEMQHHASELQDGDVRPKWYDLKHLHEDILTFPIDKKVAQLLLNHVFTKK